MPRKPVRGRFFFKLPLDGGGSFTVESDKEKSIDERKMVECLRHYADFIEKHFLKRNESVKAVDASDPHADSTGTPTPRAKRSSSSSTSKKRRPLVGMPVR